MARRKSNEDVGRTQGQLLKSLAENLTRLREGQNLTQLELASRSRLSISTISEIESRKVADVRLSSITALADALKCDEPLKLLRR